MEIEKKYYYEHFVLEFFKKDFDKNFSFKILNSKNNEDLTKTLSASWMGENRVVIKKISIKKIDKAANSILNRVRLLEEKGKVKTEEVVKYDLISNYIEKEINEKEEIFFENAMGVLSEYCQNKWRKSPTSQIIGITGCPHNPIIYVSISIPNGEVFYGHGSNKQKAKQKAANEVLNKIK